MPRFYATKSIIDVDRRSGHLHVSEAASSGERMPGVQATQLKKYGTSVRVNRMESHWVPLPAWRRLGVPEPLVGPASVPLEPEIMTAGTRDRLGLRLICNGYGSRALFLDM